MEYVGGDLKWKVDSTGAFSLDEQEWDMVFFVGTKKVTMRKRNVPDAYELTCSEKNMGFKPCSDGGWVFMLDSSFFGQGRLIAVLYAFVPDPDFDPDPDFPNLDGIRNEVRRFSLETLSNL